MKQTAYQAYQAEAKVFFAIAAELRHAYREGGTSEEIADLVDEVDTFSRCTEYPMLRERCAALLLPPVLDATGSSTA